MAITLLLHVIGLFLLVYTIQPTEIIEDVIHVDLIEPIREKRQAIKQKPAEIKPIAIATTQPIQSEFRKADTTAKVRTDAARFEAPEASNVELKADDTLPSDTLTSVADLPHTGTIAPGAGTTGTQNKQGRGIGSSSGGNARRSFGGGKFLGKGQGTGEGDATHTPDADLITKVDDDQLGAVLEGNPFELRGHIRIIRLKHSLSDWWQDPSAIPSFAQWLRFQRLHLLFKPFNHGGVITCHRSVIS